VFGYDPWGNLLSATPTQGTGLTPFSVTVNNQNRLSTLGYTYDAAGNMTASDSGRTYQWDAEGQLKSVNDGSLAVEVYNALGQRVDHTWPGNRIIWLYHPGGTEMSDFMPVPWNDWGNTYFNLNGRPIAKYIGGPGQEWDVETFFFHANAIGSTTVITWYNGDVVQKELFYPYGQLWSPGGSVSYRFAGLREWFPVSDPAHIIMSQSRDYPARFYRWMSPDPIGKKAAKLTDPQTWNMYAYVRNNPITLTDPTGLEAGLCYGCGPNGETLYPGG
jgi:RHS repeat-associated protein